MSVPPTQFLDYKFKVSIFRPVTVVLIILIKNKWGKSFLFITYYILYCLTFRWLCIVINSHNKTNYRVRHLMLPIFSWQYCLCELWERSLTTVVGFRVALDSVNNGTLVRAAAHILCGTVRVKQVDRIRAARVSLEIWSWSATWGCTFKKNNWSVGASVARDWIRTG